MAVRISALACLVLQLSQHAIIAIDSEGCTEIEIPEPEPHLAALLQRDVGKHRVTLPGMADADASTAAAAATPVAAVAASATTAATPATGVSEGAAVALSDAAAAASLPPMVSTVQATVSTMPAATAPASTMPAATDSDRAVSKEIVSESAPVAAGSDQAAVAPAGAAATATGSSSPPAISAAQATASTAPAATASDRAIAKEVTMESQPAISAAQATASTAPAATASDQAVGKEITMAPTAATATSAAATAATPPVTSATAAALPPQAQPPLPPAKEKDSKMPLVMAAGGSSSETSGLLYLASSLVTFLKDIAQTLHSVLPTSMVYLFPSLKTDIGAVFGLSLATGVIWCTLVLAFACVYRSQKAFPQAVSSRPEQDFNDWNSGPFDFFTDMKICCWSCWCPCIRWADNMDMLGIVSFWVGLLMFCSVILLISVPGGLLLWLVASLLWMSFRQQLRVKFDMEQNNLKTLVGDCAIYCCCWPCAIAQEARHIEEASRAAHKGVRKFEPSYR